MIDTQIHFNTGRIQVGVYLGRILELHRVGNGLHIEIIVRCRDLESI